MEPFKYIWLLVSESTKNEMTYGDNEQCTKSKVQRKIKTKTGAK